MKDPKPVGAVMPADLIARLKAAGHDLKPAAELDTARTETPAERQARLDARLVHAQNRWAARLPVMYAAATLDDLTDVRLRGWLASTSPTLVAAGPVGTGKTHAAYAIGNTAAAGGAWVEAWTCHDLLEAMRPSGDAATRSAVEACDVLILDDLGATKASEWAKDELTAILDRRLREGRRQIVTTNHPYDVLEETWGTRFTDRLRFGWTVVALVGESRRKAAW